MHSHGTSAEVMHKHIAAIFLVGLQQVQDGHMFLQGAFWATQYHHTVYTAILTVLCESCYTVFIVLSITVHMFSCILHIVNISCVMLCFMLGFMVGLGFPQLSLP